ncbi:hypothetical protein V2J09_015417 [Rumex salicifolius]
MVWETMVPFTAMVLTEGMTIALTITVNSAMQNGMNQFVFVAYSNALSSLILLPYSYFFHKHSKFCNMREMLSVKLLIRFFLLGFTGKTKLDLRKTSGKIRIVGSLVTFTGAAVVATYKGPSILEEALMNPAGMHQLQAAAHPLFVFVSSSSSSQKQWLLGCLLLATATFFLALWSILQVSTFKKLPDMMTIVTWYVIFGTIQTVLIDVLANRHLAAWKLSFNLELLIIIFTAVFGTFVRSRVQAWCMRTKGAVYVSLFKPFGIFWACAISLSFFGNTLHIGSVTGAAVSGIGYYTMLWGSVKEEEEKKKTEESDKLGEFVKDDDDGDQLKAPLLSKVEDQV